MTMARRYEYIIHGPPLSPTSATTSPRRTLHSRRDSQKVANLRSLYRTSGSPTQHAQVPGSLKDDRKSSPTTPKLPPTPPTGNEQDEQAQEYPLTNENDATVSQPVPTTPVNQNSPPTPEHTPPRNTLKAPLHHHLALRPSLASTRAESFRTAYEHPQSNDDFARSNLTLHSAFASPQLAPQSISDPIPEEHPHTGLEEDDPVRLDHIVSEPLASQIPLPLSDEHIAEEMGKDTPETQFRFELLDRNHAIMRQEPEEIEDDSPGQVMETLPRQRSIHDQVTMSLAQDLSKREKSLHDRLQERAQFHDSASTEAFANVIGWNDGRHDATHTDSENRSNRWSGNSNPSAVEAYVVDSPIKPRKRGTLRKVVKNDSLRAVSSPLPDSKRTSLQSTSDSSHRLVHKKARLTNQNRWSTGSDISRRSLSLNSASPWPKTEIITVAIIPEKGSSFHTSASSSRGHSRSMSVGSGNHHSNMPPVSTPIPRRKRAFSDSAEKTSVDEHTPRLPVRRSSPSVPTSRSQSRANSVSSEQFSLQRKQAEKDLRITLDRMESERLSASLRRSSLQSSPPTPTQKPAEKPADALMLQPNDAQLSRGISSAGNSTRSGHRAIAIGAPRASKEWPELRPPTIVGTPFSQASNASPSPEIIEAKVVSFFPHHNESLQLIEPNRLSESQAVRALKDRPMGRSNTVAAMQISTPRNSNHDMEPEAIDSPLRNPRKPPMPPQLELTPATPLSELNGQLDSIPGPTLTKSRIGTLIGNRPSLPGRDRSESFIKQMTRNFSTRNAKNPKADQELDGTSNPFWRPRAFWDDPEYSQRIQREQEKSTQGIGEPAEPAMTDADVSNTVTILEDEPVKRSNTITAGPAALVRKISERKRQRKLIDEHISQQQALVKQSSYSSLQKFKAGRRMYGMPPMRSLSLNMGALRNLQDRVVQLRVRREDSRRERKRAALRKSIGTEVVSQGDSRFVNDKSTTRRYDPTEEMLQNARDQDLVEKMRERGIRV